MIRTVWAFLIVFLVGNTLQSQMPPPLPDSLKATAWSNPAETIFPIGAPTGTDDVHARVTYYADEQTLELRWKIRREGAYIKEEVEEFALSFVPTAVCTERGTGPSFFVAGYVERTGHVVIEEWRFEDMAFGATTPRGGGPGQSTFSRTIRKSTVLITDQLKPLKAIAFHATSEVLWVFEEEPPHTVWTVHPETGAMTWRFDRTVIPAVALTHTVSTTMIEPPAPQTGFVIRLEPWRPWSRWPLVTESDLDAVELYVFRDADLDGENDESTILTGAEYASRGWWEYTNPFYQ